MSWVELTRHSNDPGHWDKVWRRLAQEEWDVLSEEIFSTLKAELGNLNGLRILEAGSGSGRISARLAEYGARVTLVDFSAVALSQSKTRFYELGLAGNFVRARIEQLPLKHNLYDVVWSAGVLEHYTEDEQIAQLKELVRVLRPGGKLVVLVPAADCLLYRVYKWFAELTGTWPYGYERPLKTLVPQFAASGLTDCHEYSVAFETALDIGSQIPGANEFVSLLRFWYKQLPIEERRCWPGYLLVAVGHKPGIERTYPVRKVTRELRLERKDWQVVVLAGVNYEYLWQRPQQMAREFQGLGYRTVYVQSTNTKLTAPTLPRPSELDSILRSVIVRLTRWDQDVAVTSAVTHIAAEGGHEVPVLDVWLRNMVQLFELRRPIFWVTHQAWGHVIDLLKLYGTVVYDCVDELSEFRGVTPQALAGERLLIERADMITVTARNLLESRSRLHPRVHLVPNGVDPEHIGKYLHRPLPRRWRSPVVGFVGSLAYWVDTDLVSEVARARPGWTFVLAGPHEGAALEPLSGLPNVILLGRVQYSKIPEILAQFDVGIVPFRVTAFTNNANPIKIYEYLAAGLPVVTTPLVEASAFGDLVSVAAGPEEFASAVTAALASNTPDIVRRRVEYARANSWQLRATVSASLATAYDAARRGESETARGILLAALESCSNSPEMQVEVLAGMLGTDLVEEVSAALNNDPTRIRQLLHELNDRRVFPAARKILPRLLAQASGKHVEDQVQTPDPGPGGGADSGSAGQGITLAESRSVHILVIPNWDDPDDRWWQAIKEFVSQFAPNEDVGLIIRLDPLAVPRQDLVLVGMRERAASEGIDLDAGHMILILNDWLEPSQRKLVYATSHVFVTSSMTATGLALRTEAERYGLVVCEPTGESMRSAVEETLRRRQGPQPGPAGGTARAG